MKQSKYSHCQTCWRADHEGMDNSKSSDYCRACTKKEGAAFPSMFILHSIVPKEDFDEARMDIIGPNGNEGLHYAIIDEVMEDARKEMKETSDGSTASYYTLPEGASELQDLIAFKNMNAQLGEIFRATYRYGQCSHSDKVREMNKVIFYAEAEINRLAKYEKQTTEDKK